MVKWVAKGSMRISRIGIWIRISRMRQGVQGVRGNGLWSRETRWVYSRVSRHTPHALRSSHGFTILEIIIVLFLLVGLLGIILPRISLDDNLGSVGRRIVGTVRSLQSLAITTQKTIRLYVDIDRGIYWPVILDGNQEKLPIDPLWATPLKLSETTRFLDILVAQGKKEA